MEPSVKLDYFCTATVQGKTSSLVIPKLFEMTHTCISQEAKLRVCTASVEKQVWKLQIFKTRPLSWLYGLYQMILCKFRNLASLGWMGGGGGREEKKQIAFTDE